MPSSDNATLSVVVPTLNEADSVGALLGDLARQTIPVEVIVADGGSVDETTSIALDAGATVISASRGRGAQMNAGRAVAARPDLLFLHADSRLPDERLLERASKAWHERRRQRGDDLVAGHFELRFTGTQARDAFRFLEAKTALNRQHTTNGDQGLLVTARWFDELGSFDESMEFLEDQRFGLRVNERGEWMTLPGIIETSARRFMVEGFGRRYFVMAVIMAVWEGGAEEFFESAPHVYRAQSETDELELGPVFGAIWQTMRRIGPRRTFEAWLRVGRFSRENAWQPFFALDVMLRDELDGARPFLELYDERVAPLIDTPVADAVMGIAAFTVVAVALPIWEQLS